MLKKMIALLLLLSILPVFSGCGKMSDETTAPTMPTYSGEVPNVVNGVYATCENYDFTVYKRGMTKAEFIFYLVCENALPSDAAVVLNDVEADCPIEFVEITPRSQSVNREIYMFMQDPAMDWAAHYAERERLFSELERLKKLVYGEDGPQNGETFDSTQGDGKAYVEASRAYFNFVNQCSDESEAYNESREKPQWHLYRVTVQVRSVGKREQLKSFTLNAGEMSRQIPMKNVWVDPQEIPGNNFASLGVKTKSTLDLPSTQVDSNGNGFYLETDYFSEGDRAAGKPWEAGTTAVRLNLIAEKDINLKNVYSYGDNDRIKVEFVELVVIGTQGTVVTSKWYPGTDLMIRKGEQVAMQICWSDPATEQANYAMNAVFIIEYEVDGTISKLRKELCLSRSLLSSAELYLWVFKGMDFESFYREYANELEGYTSYAGVFG